MSSAAGEEYAPGRLWSLWDLMKAFNLGTCCSLSARLMQIAQVASTSTPDDLVTDEWRIHIVGKLIHIQVVCIVLNLVETRAAIERLKKDFENNVSNKEVQYGIHHLLELMQSEMDKRKVLAIEAEKTKFYIDDSYGTSPPIARGLANTLLARPNPEPLFGDRAELAFPSAYMDIIEAGRCLALGRNNAAVYHLMCVAEIGLRTLAWDRRVEAKLHKKVVPLAFAQWGELIGKIEPKVEEIKKWRSRHSSAEAQHFYNSALVEIRAFNAGWRTHIMHARAHAYEADEAIALFGHVQRFMSILSDKISEEKRTPTVWKNKKAKN